MCRELAKAHRRAGVTWHHSCPVPSERRSFCIVDGPSPEAVRIAADTVTDRNMRAIDFVVAAGLANQPAHRGLAIAHSAAYDAALQVSKPQVASSATAVDAVDSACDAALAALPAGAAKEAGNQAGESAAALRLAQRADDGSTATDDYRPMVLAGRYMPTPIPASPH
ncbi:MAG: hypothetical protein KA387_07475 [Rubrivivax sp.]|nr:hypothetical protein [Rubrivivax sp.]